MTREKNKAEIEAEAVRGDPELQAALEDLKKDAPPGEGPFLRNMAHLRRPAKESERQEAGVAEIGTNPVARESRTALENKVVVKPKAADTPEADHALRQQITLPGTKKKQELGVVEDLEFGGRAPAGTLRFKNPVAAPPAEVAPRSAAPPVVAPAPVVAPPTEVIGEPPKNSRSWIWIAVILLSLGTVVVIVASTRGTAEPPAPTERTAVASPASTATATQTAVVAVATATVATPSVQSAGPGSASPQSQSATFEPSLKPIPPTSQATEATPRSTSAEKPQPTVSAEATVSPLPTSLPATVKPPTKSSSDIFPDD